MERTHLQRSESRGQFHRLLRSVRHHCDSEGAGLAGFIASAVTERSTVEFEGTAAGIAEAGSIA
jgi:hypothetical protein